jgi:hypothetical protein
MWAFLIHRASVLKSLLLAIHYDLPFLRDCIQKDTAILTRAWTGPLGSRRLRLPEVLHNQHTKVVRLSALDIGRFYTPVDTSRTPHGHSAPEGLS